jgi:hypothetical protein
MPATLLHVIVDNKKHLPAMMLCQHALAIPQVFAQLATVNSGCMGNGVQLCYTDRPTGPDCFSTIACTPHAGLRQYPFLGQVWQSHWLFASELTANLLLHTSCCSAPSHGHGCACRCASGGAIC